MFTRPVAFHLELTSAELVVGAKEENKDGARVAGAATARRLLRRAAVHVAAVGEGCNVVLLSCAPNHPAEA